MEKIMKIDCYYDINNKICNWSGKFLRDGNKIKGIAYDDTKGELYFLIGNFIKDKGIKLLKIPCDENNKYNITSCIMKKLNGHYCGDVYKESQFGSNPIGYCAANIYQFSFFVADSQDLIAQIRQARSAIKDINSLGNFLINDAEKEQTNTKAEMEIENFYNSKKIK